MALQLEIVGGNDLPEPMRSVVGDGVSVAYHRIADYRAIPGRGLAVTLYSHVDHAARLADSVPVASSIAHLRGAMDSSSLSRAEVYEMIKSDPRFAGAVDI